MKTLILPNPHVSVFNIGIHQPRGLFIGCVHNHIKLGTFLILYDNVGTRMSLNMC